MVHYYGQYRPDKINIMGSEWTIKWFADMEDMGLCDMRSQTIEISKSVSPKMSVDVLLHEVLHAIWWMGCLPSKAKEEQAVSVMATGLNQVMSSNPLLAKWVDEIHHS